jgi:hypothetical protein
MTVERSRRRPPNLATAEMNGQLDGSSVTELLAASPSPEARALAGAVAATTLRMNVDEDVAASFDVSGKTPEQGEQLRKMLTATLAVGRARAQQEGKTDLANLLDQALVQEHADGAFGLDVALPGAMLLDAMGCDADGTPRGKAALEAGGAPPPIPAPGVP